MVSEREHDIKDAIYSLKEAKQNLKRIEKEYAEEPILLKIYSYSAKEMISNLENHLEYLLKLETETELSIISEIDPLDLWIRIEGKSFHNGTGPINVVGSYLKKLNTAVRHSARLVKKKFEVANELNNFFPTFELAATAKGSLKLGLQNNVSNNLDQIIEPTLFNVENKDNTLEQLKQIQTINDITDKSITVLFKALASANDDTFIRELTKEYDEDDVIKLIHYAQELAPSSRSSIDFISFEGNQIRDFKELKTDKNTRSYLKQRAQRLRQNKVFIEGTAFIKQYTVDSDKTYYSLIARSFKYDNNSLDEIELRLNKEEFSIEQKDVYNQLIFVSGFLHYNANNQPYLIEADSINFELEEIYGDGE
ncbi:hypothetical protein NDK25_24555 [Niallia taxi]|nr:hypothetical protein [Niallia taxi]MDE5055391.1 hypothetical protein [Niallia taxi]